MTAYVADHETGAPLCPDCAATADHWPCNTEWCQCWCVIESGRALEMDDRAADKLTVIANDLESERRGSLRDLTTERFGGFTT